MNHDTTPDLFDLSGRVVIVTGGSRGIGRAICLALAARGAKVIVSSRHRKACQDVVDTITAAGGRAHAMACHIGHKDDLHRLVDDTITTCGALDAVVANAATNPVYGPLAEMSDTAWDKIMETNVRGTFWLANKAAPHIAARGGGAIVILSSIAALTGNTVIGTYGVSKAAEAALARNLAVEWGPKNIRVNAIAPGLIRTDFAKALLEDPARQAAAEQRTPLRRIGEPEDIAGIAVMLVSRAGAYITGQTLVADGGETITG